MNHHGNARRTLVSALVCGALSLVPTLGFAQDSYPSGPVTMMVPYPAGGPSDTIARALNGPIGEHLGAQVIVENLGGATGAIAANRVLNAKTDGSYIYQGTGNELILPPLINDAVRFKPTDFQSVHPITTSNLVLLVKQDLPVNNVEEFVALAKERASSSPLTYGSIGVGSLYHLITERMSKTLDVPLIHAPYRGTAPAMQDLAGGQIDFTIMPFSKVMKEMEKDGRYRIIAVLSDDKPEILQEYASLSDHPLFKDFHYKAGSAYFVKKGTPQHIIDKLNAAIAHAVQDPRAIELLEGDGRVVAKPATPAEAQERYMAEIKMADDTIRETGFQSVN